MSNPYVLKPSATVHGSHRYTVGWRSKDADVLSEMKDGNETSIVKDIVTRIDNNQETCSSQNVPANSSAAAQELDDNDMRVFEREKQNVSTIALPMTPARVKNIHARARPETADIRLAERSRIDARAKLAKVYSDLQATRHEHMLCQARGLYGRAL